MHFLQTATSTRSLTIEISPLLSIKATSESVNNYISSFAFHTAHNRAHALFELASWSPIVQFSLALTCSSTEGGSSSYKSSGNMRVGIVAATLLMLLISWTTATGPSPAAVVAATGEDLAHAVRSTCCLSSCVVTPDCHRAPTLRTSSCIGGLHRCGKAVQRNWLQISPTPYEKAQAFECNMQVVGSSKQQIIERGSMARCMHYLLFTICKLVVDVVIGDNGIRYIRVLGKDNELSVKVCSE